MVVADVRSICFQCQILSCTRDALDVNKKDAIEAVEDELGGNFVNTNVNV